MSNLITVELPKEDWIKILDMLADFPYRKTAPLIDAMQQQLMPQIKPNLLETGDK